MVPMGSYLDAPDTNHQTIRRLQAVDLPASSPSRYFRGPYVTALYRNMLNNSSIDWPHLSQSILSIPGITHINSGYGEQMIRIAKRIAFLEGWATSDENGPRLLSAVRSGNTVVCTYDPNGGTLEVRNTAYINDFRCGHDFATDTAFSSLIFPTNATVSGNEVTFTFASLSGPVYVRSHWGARPFARGQNVFTLHTGSGGTGTDAVFLDPPNRASMVSSLYSDGRWVEVQPSFNAGGTGVDYVTAS